MRRSAASVPVAVAAGEGAKRSERHLDALHRLASAVSLGGGVDAISTEALDVLIQALAADRAAVLLLDADGVMRFTASRGLSAGYRQAVEGHSPWAPDAAAPQPVLIPDVGTDPDLGPLREVIQREGIAAVAFIPLLYGERLLGKFMVYFDRPHPFSAEEVDLARTVAGHIAFALEKRRLEEELRATSEELGAILNAVGEAITVLDGDGNFVWANDAAAELMGFSSAPEFLATPVAEVMARFEVLDQLGRAFPLAELPGRRALTGEEPPEALLRWRVRASGDERWSLVRGRPVLDGGGRVRFSVSVFRDVTERQQALDALRRSEERFAFLASASRSLLASSLDVEVLARRMSELAVPALADWCTVWELDDEHRPQMLACHVGPGYRPGLAEGLRTCPRLLADHPLWQEVGEGETVLVDGPGLLDPSTSDAPQHRLLSEVGAQELLAVPIPLRGGVAGAALLARSTMGRYEDGDVALAQDLARRGGQVLDIIRTYEAEHRARAGLELLSELSRVLFATLEVDQVLRSLADRVVPTFADRCVIDFVDRGGAVTRVAVRGCDPDLDARLQASNPSRDEPVYPVVRALRGQTTYFPEIDDDILRDTVDPSRHLELLRKMAATSAVIVPIAGRTGSVGAITFATADASGRRFRPHDVALAEEIGHRAGAAVDNARLFSEHSQAAATLAQALLPAALTEIPGVDIAARYRPATGAVGGDFYDIVALGDGRWLGMVGDVCGKGAEAASLTAMARHTIRSLSRHYDEAGAVLDAANDAMADQLPEGRFCTAATVVLEPGGRSLTATIAIAGHPVPLVIRRSGEVVALGRPGTPLGVLEQLGVIEEEVVLEQGDALVLFTDGCVGEGGDSLQVLRECLTAVAGQSAAAIAEAVEATAIEIEGGHRDDMAILVFRARRDDSPPGPGVGET